MARLRSSRATAARLRAERLTALSRSPLSIVGRTIKLLKPRRSKTRSSSKRENPWLPLPVRNITVIPFTAGDTIGTVGNNIKGAMLAWALVSISFAPGIQRHILLEVGTIPSFEAARLGPQSLKTFLGARIASDIEPKRIQSRAQELNLGLGSFDLRLFFLTNEARPYQRREQPDDNHHN